MHFNLLNICYIYLSSIALLPPFLMMEDLVILSCMHMWFVGKKFSSVYYIYIVYGAGAAMTVTLLVVVGLAANADNDNGSVLTTRCSVFLLLLLSSSSSE